MEQGPIACCATDSCSPRENAFRSSTRRPIDGHCQEEGRRQKERWEKGRRQEERWEEGCRQEGPCEESEARAKSGIHEGDDALWQYIKKNNLQDAKNRRMINADDKLKPVFGGKGQVSMFDMTKLVNKHLK
jgi:hypothetical protein